MVIKDNWYLLWDPLNKWQVYNELSVPDPGAFPDYMYRRYSVDREKGIKFMRELILIKTKLNEKEIIPSLENQEEIFPSLEGVLKNVK